MFEVAAEFGSIPAVTDDDRSDLATFYAALNKAWFAWNRMHMRRESQAAQRRVRTCRDDCLLCGIENGC